MASTDGAGGDNCGCTGEFWIDVRVGDETLSLTAPAPDVWWPLSAPGATTATFTGLACSPPNLPWGTVTTGQTAIVADAQACTTYGAGIPCLWLSRARGPFFTATHGVYRDRNGGEFELLLSDVTPRAPVGPVVPSAIEGTFTGALADGRAVSGTFRVCALRVFTVT